MSDVLLVGAVAYHPRIVTIWERFLDYFAAVGAPTDYVLYSNYERLVDALLGREVEIAWNTNTAYVAAEHVIGGDAQVLGMRDVDRDFRTVIVTRRGEVFESPQELEGKRLALGSRDSGHAAILPLHYLARAGLKMSTLNLVRFDTDLGKHGDTGDSELEVAEAVVRGDVDAGALGDATWVALRAEGHPAVGGLELAWRSPTYYHCNFTALPSLDRERAGRWTSALLAMNFDDPTLRPAMELEGVRRWLAGDKAGYVELDRGDEGPGLPRVTIRRCDAGTLELGAGLEVFVSAALESTAQGGELDVESASRSSAFELAAWARLRGHEVGREWSEGHGSQQRFVVRLRRLSPSVAPPPLGPALRDASSGFPTSELREVVGKSPATVDHEAGLVPLGALSETVAARRPRLATERPRRDLGRRARRPGRSRSPRSVGCCSRHPVAGDRRGSHPRSSGPLPR